MLELLVTLTKEEDMNLFKQADGYIIANHDTAVRIAGSFSLETMQKVIRKAKVLEKKIYLNFNKIFVQQEVADLETLFLEVVKLDFNGIFFSDFAVFTLAKKAGIADKLIYASETQIVNYRDIAALSKVGIKTYQVSKEMTYENIVLTASKVEVAVGMLAFGHYNMFYSKRKLVTNFKKEFQLDHFEVENRMDLAIKEKTRQQKLPIVQTKNGTNIFSYDIMCAIEELLPLAKQGIKFFVFDTIFIDTTVTNQVLKLFKQSLIEQITFTIDDVIKITKLTNISKGFLFKDIGLR